MSPIPPVKADLPTTQVQARIPTLAANQALAELQEGVQLRDYFAAKVMAQIQKQFSKGHNDGWDGMASMAYSYADAMIRVRGKTTRGINSCNQ